MSPEFVAGTQVLTKDGLKNIEDIKVGELVKAENAETGEQAYKPVTDLIRRHDRIIWDVIVDAGDKQSETFHTTDEHPWWVPAEKEWLRTDELKAGMQVKTADGKLVNLSSITNTYKSDATYNFTVADFNTYFVGELKVLVHNCKEKSINQMNKDIDKGNAPNGLKRFDKGNTNTKTQDHVHKTDGTAMNKDGSVHDSKNGEPKFNNKEKKFLKKNKWPTKVKKNDDE